MVVHVAFLRAINVGNRRVSADRLRRPFEDLGFQDVSTFIASGNVIFGSDDKGVDLEAVIEPWLTKAVGFDVITFIRPVSRLARIVGEVPLPHDGSDDLVHVGFLKKATTASTRRALNAIGNDTDTVTSRSKEIYWLARQGMGRATVSGAALEKALGQPTTFRSLKMLRRLHARLS